MKPVALGPWPLGIQNVNDLTMLQAGALADAVNVYLDSGGVAYPRKGWAPVTPDAHSLFRLGSRTFGVFEGSIAEFFDTGVRKLYGDGIGKVTWCVLNGEPVFVNNALLGRITPDGVKLIGLDPPTGVVGGTGLILGAVTFVDADDNESAASGVVVGGVVSYNPPTDPAVSKVRIYASRGVDEVVDGARTPVSAGSTLYLVSETGAAGVQTEAYGRPLESLNKARMPGGSFARYWRGRLLVARGRTLYYSDPLRYGVYDARTGFVQFEGRIEWIESLEGGVYVSVAGIGVVFLRGEAPEKWERKLASIVPAQPGAVGVVPTAQMKLDSPERPDWVAVWFTNKGFAVGLPSGNVIFPQAGLLSGLPLGTGNLHFEGDRLIVLSQ